MTYSVEHSNNFHMARRIVKIIAPDFRVFATEDLQEGHAVLDLTKKTIEVPESRDEISTVALILFQLGHLRLKGLEEFDEHLGNIKDIGEKRLIAKLSKQAAKADKLSAEWAVQVLKGVFDVAPNQALSLVEDQIWDEDEWKSYFLKP